MIMLADRDEEPRPKDRTPPGDFLSEDMRAETARFLDEVKRQIKKRREPKEEPKLGPPRRDKRR